MEISLFVNSSERQAINKILSSGISLLGSLRSETSVINPSILIEHNNPSSFNYCYISDFNRYYFITNITSVRTNLWRIDCAIDVLMSFKEQILALNVIVGNNTAFDDESYYDGEAWQTLVKTKSDVLMFPNGLLDSGEYILITSGGVAT